MIAVDIGARCTLVEGENKVDAQVTSQPAHSEQMPVQLLIRIEAVLASAASCRSLLLPEQHAALADVGRVIDDDGTVLRGHI